jgi:hypothetical protein
VGDLVVRDTRIGVDRERQVVVALVVLALVLALPYVLIGPRLVLDDWWLLRNRHFGGVLATAPTSETTARPGAWVVFTLTYGLIGAHPLVLYLVQTMLNVAVTIMLFRTARRFLPLGPAGTIAAVWAILPNHASLDHWAATINVVVALLLLLTGVHLLGRDDYGRGADVVAVAYLVASVLTYEATGFAAIAALVAVPWLVRQQVDRALLLGGGLALAAAGIWVVSNSPKDYGAPVADLALLYPLHFGQGIAITWKLGQVLGLVAAIGIGVTLARLVSPSLRPATGTPERLVLAGLAVIVLGSLAATKAVVLVEGVNDRLNVVASTGTAMAWVGFGWQLWRVRAARAVAVALGVAFFLMVAPTRIGRDLDYHRAGDDATRLLEDLARYYPAPKATIAIGPHRIFHHGVPGFIGAFDTSAALQLVRDDRSLEAYWTADPLEFAQAPTPLRFDAVARRPATPRPGAGR